ncbi:Intrinsic membrane protein PufX [Tranquillimonas rosea]|uniref:Intrinsic membrane protein PufX n=1 Tax=Tranquillimonas rosea TaxID=641238 RepID=A0A1H9SIW2_9RHOB|nr:RC-LH1 core complex protein PufX [Tranquillimonas rosea]SER84970.1 Intrinsic membrane protein PufX [Tranquillimonas rosea]
MSDKLPWYLENERPGLGAWIFTQMTVGAAYAALVLAAAIAFILILKVISRLLPEDPYAALDAGLRVTGLA